jgi:hypothetical protein
MALVSVWSFRVLHSSTLRLICPSRVPKGWSWGGARSSHSRWRVRPTSAHCKVISSRTNASAIPDPSGYGPADLLRDENVRICEAVCVLRNTDYFQIPPERMQSLQVGGGCSLSALRVPTSPKLKEDFDCPVHRSSAHGLPLGLPTFIAGCSVRQASKTEVSLFPRLRCMQSSVRCRCSQGPQRNHALRAVGLPIASIRLRDQVHH